MRWILAVRQLMVRPGRAALLLGGYAIGVSVMVVLLSISEAMLEQSRDPVLIGGGDVLVVPEGIDLEAIRTGGIGGLFQGIDRARFVIRQQLGGPRLADVVASISPTIDQRSLTMQFNGRTFAVRAGAGIPSRAVAMGVGLDVVDGAWHDSRADSLWLAPTDDQLYDELDRWHLPVRRDSTWAEWHYFNIQPSADEWWYVTLMVVGDVPDGQWGGQLLVTRRTPDGEYHRWADTVSTDAIRFDTTGARTVGISSVLS